MAWGEASIATIPSGRVRPHWRWAAPAHQRCHAARLDRRCGRGGRGLATAPGRAPEWLVGTALPPSRGGRGICAWWGHLGRSGCQLHCRAVAPPGPAPTGTPRGQWRVLSRWHVSRLSVLPWRCSRALKTMSNGLASVVSSGPVWREAGCATTRRALWRSEERGRSRGGRCGSTMGWSGAGGGWEADSIFGQIASPSSDLKMSRTNFGKRAALLYNKSPCVSAHIDFNL